MDKDYYPFVDDNNIFKDLFYISPNPIVILNSQGVLLLANKAVSDTLGISKEELIHKNYKEIGIFTEETLEACEQTFSQIIKGADIKSFEIEMKTRSNELLHFEAYPRVFKNHKRALMIYITFYDITKSKQVDKERLRELNLAKMVQESVLSPSLQNEHITIEGRYIPADNIGGDMYFWNAIDENRYGIFVLDVMGHGISSSLVCMSIRALLRGIIQKIADPVLVMAELNNHMNQMFHQNNQDISYYFTGIYLLINTKERTIEYINAGHPPGIVLVSHQTVMPLPISSVPVGLTSNVVFKKEVISYSVGTKVLLYTDGLIQQSSQQSIGSIISDFISFMQEYSFSNDSPLLNYILEKRIGNKKLDDDISLVEVRL